MVLFGYQGGGTDVITLAHAREMIKEGQGHIIQILK